MAEQVQASLDAMVEPMRDLLDRGIFSENEVKAIVSRRRASEYLLRRRAARKADFIRYIEDEIKLEQLRDIRTRKLSHNTTKTHKSQLPIGDVHIVQLIHLLFVRAIRKFRADINLHLQHAAFSKASHSYSRLSLIYTQALQVHPRHIPLWIEAASYEFFGHQGATKSSGGGSVQTARVLLQRGLRINPSACDLWLQYFSLELHHIQKLKGRQEILQISDDTFDDDKAPIPRVVYRNAIKAIPAQVPFRCQFLDICRLFPKTQSLQDDILASIENDFGTCPNAWVARAAYLAEQNEHVAEDEKPSKRTKRSTDPVLTLLQEGMDAIPTADMFLQCLVFAREYGSHKKEKTHMKQFITAMLETCQKDGIQSSDLVLELARYFIRQEQYDQALEVVQNFCMSTNDTKIGVWIQWAQLTDKPGPILQRALHQTQMNTNEYVVLLLEYIGALLQDELVDFTQVQNVFEKILLLSPGRVIDFQPVFGVESVASACLHYLHYAIDSGGLVKAREVMDFVLLRSNFCASPVGKTDADLNLLGEFFDGCIALEIASKSKQTRNQLKKLYDAAISLYKDCSPAKADAFRKKRDHDVRFALQ